MRGGDTHPEVPPKVSPVSTTGRTILTAVTARCVSSPDPAGERAFRPWSAPVRRTTIEIMNAPWWKMTTDRQSRDGSQLESDDSGDDLLPPFVD